MHVTSKWKDGRTRQCSRRHLTQTRRNTRKSKPQEQSCPLQQRLSHRLRQRRPHTLRQSKHSQTSKLRPRTRTTQQLHKRPNYRSKRPRTQKTPRLNGMPQSRHRTHEQHRSRPRQTQHIRQTNARILHSHHSIQKNRLHRRPTTRKHHRMKRDREEQQKTTNVALTTPHLVERKSYPFISFFDLTLRQGLTTKRNISNVYRNRILTHTSIPTNNLNNNQHNIKSNRKILRNLRRHRIILNIARSGSILKHRARMITRMRNNHALIPTLKRSINRTHLQGIRIGLKRLIKRRTHRLTNLNVITHRRHIRLRSIVNQRTHKLTSLTMTKGHHHRILNHTHTRGQLNIIRMSRTHIKGLKSRNHRTPSTLNKGHLLRRLLTNVMSLRTIHNSTNKSTLIIAVRRSKNPNGHPTHTQTRNTSSQSYPTRNLTHTPKGQPRTVKRSNTISINRSRPRPYLRAEIDTTHAPRTDKPRCTCDSSVAHAASPACYSRVTNITTSAVAQAVNSIPLTQADTQPSPSDTISAPTATTLAHSSTVATSLSTAAAFLDDYK